MNALTVDLMGDSPMDEATIQARAQDIIAATWPAWKRERALRLANAVQIAALNAFFDSVAADVDLARENSALLQAALDVEAAQRRLLQQEDVENEIDTAERATAQAVIDGASEQVMALVASRVPAPEPEQAS